MQKFCEHIGKPVWILTENEVVDIIFSSKAEPENHFWLSWSNEGILKIKYKMFFKPERWNSWKQLCLGYCKFLLGCGGDITSPTTIIVDIGKLVNNSKIYECTWKIIAPIGMRILFQIEKLSVFKITEDCTGNSGEEFSGLAVSTTNKGFFN